MSGWSLPRAAVIAVAAFSVACGRSRDADPRLVSAWMRSLYGTIRVERLSPPVASRLAAYSTVALYSGVIAGRPTEPSLAGVLNGLPALPRSEPGLDYDATLVAVEAERVVLDSLLFEGLPTTRAALARLADSLTTARITAGVSVDAQSRSLDLGRQIGLAVVAWSRTDGFDSTRGRSYAAPKGPGLWVNDAPASTFATQSLSATSELVVPDNPANVMKSGNVSDRSLILSRPKRVGSGTMPAVNMAGASEPYWGQVRPFVLTSWNECPVSPPPEYSTDTASFLYRDARQVADVKQELTPEHRTIALYWADNAGESGTPVGHWLSIASQQVSERHLSAVDAARLLALTAVAQADAFIASWGYKYQYSLIRPRTYIRRFIDPAWEPLIPTPPFPEYPSGHSTQSAAAAAAMTGFLGRAAFDDSTSISIGHSVRRFASFTAASEEAGLSRIYGGIHFASGNTSGLALGRCIGEKVIERLHVARVQ